MSIQVKDGAGASKYYETTGAGDATNPFQAVVPDYRLQHAVKFIEDTYSDTGTVLVDLDPYIIALPNSDIRVIATSNAANTQVEAAIHGYLAIIT